jgi:hypothetical protein
MPFPDRLVIDRVPCSDESLGFLVADALVSHVASVD